MPGASITGALDYDFGFDRVGKAHLTVAVPLAAGRYLVEATVRRYLPYFSLSTIWGFFEPVGYEEVELRAGWSRGATLGLWGSAGVRRYGDAGAAVVLRPLEDDGRRFSAGARVVISQWWTVEARYRLEWGPGGFLSSGDASARWRPSERLSVAVSGTTFQQVEQYRLGDGRALGAGVSVDAALNGRVSFAGGFSLLRHRRALGL